MTKSEFEALAKELHFLHLENSHEAGMAARMTNRPIFVVQHLERIYGIKSDYPYLLKRTAYLYKDNYFHSLEELEANGIDLKDTVQEQYITTYQDTSIHLTEKAAEEYIERNGEYLTEPRIYVKSAYYWDQMRELIDLIATGKVAWK